MDPTWTKEIKFKRRAEDPLGLARVSGWITSELLPGITTTTVVARNYSFYCWSIYDLLQKAKIRNRSDFADELTKRESAFVVASLLHHQKEEGVKTPHGYNVGSRILENSHRTVRMNFRVSRSNPEGFYGLYYRGSLNALGLTSRRRGFDELTRLGREVALAYEDNIKKTKYYLNYITKNIIPKNVLREYGEKACICALKRKTRERELLRKIFFSENPSALNLESSRKDTLLMVLVMIRKCDEKNVFFEDHVFRNIIFYSQFSDGNKIYGFDQSHFIDIWTRWRFFQFHEYFSFALEAILSSFVKELKAEEKGLTLDDFLENVGQFNKTIDEKISTESREQVINVITSILLLFGCKEFGKESCSSFDQKCNLSSRINEETIASEIDDLIERDGETSQIVGLSILLLLFLLIRYFHYHNSFDEKFVWYRSKAIEELSLVSFVDEMKQKLDVLSIHEFLEHIINLVILQHNLIAWDKLHYGNDTFRFREPTPGRYHFARDFEPTWRNTKIGGMLAILEDLGLCTTSEESRSLTDDALNLLQRKV